MLSSSWILERRELLSRFGQRLFWHGQSETIGQKFLFLAMALAFALHLAMYGVWQQMPRDGVVDIPVRVLNIKLADMDEPVSASVREAPASQNSDGVEQAINKVMKDIEQTNVVPEVADKVNDKVAEKSPPAKKAAAAPSNKPLKTKPFDVRSEGTAVAAPVQSVVATQYVREAQPAKLGDAKGEDMITRYEQMISSWIDKFKPEKLMVSGQPERAVASVRIRIDRRGNIRFLELEKRSGLEELDRAALETVRRANPVPAVPADYPSGELVEFIVPIVFTR
jgi:protein TonB